MSTYVTMKGQLRFPNSAAMASAVKILTSGHWIEDNNLVDETGHPYETSDSVSESDLSIKFPYGTYRNITRVLKSIASLASSGEVRVGCSDGDFWLAAYMAGGSVENVSVESFVNSGGAVTFSADDLYGDNVDFDNEEEFEDFSSWQQEVIDCFIG